jgi:hypothetical protein
MLMELTHLSKILQVPSSLAAIAAMGWRGCPRRVLGERSMLGSYTLGTTGCRLRPNNLDTVTPHFTESLIKLIKLQLSLDARLIKSPNFEFEFKGND